jgi:hypothetical protein
MCEFAGILEAGVQREYEMKPTREGEGNIELAIERLIGLLDQHPSGIG